MFPILKFTEKASIINNSLGQTNLINNVGRYVCIHSLFKTST